MPDITMCQDKECPQRLECYRFTAKPNEYRQSYFAESPRRHAPDGKCPKRMKQWKPREVDNEHE